MAKQARGQPSLAHPSFGDVRGKAACLRGIHDRMPIILEPDAWWTWLGERPGDPAALLRPAAEDVSRS